MIHELSANAQFSESPASALRTSLTFYLHSCSGFPVTTTFVSNMGRGRENAVTDPTSFCPSQRPEMVAVAEKHYGVLFNAQKISTIRTITRDEAHEFVESSAEPAR